jgi:ankyrin repeat protein
MRRIGMGKNELFEACESDDLGAVAKLLKDKNIDLNAFNEHGYTPLHFACSKGLLEVVKLLLKNERVNLNKVNIFCETPLHMACEYGHIEVIKFLIQDNRVDISSCNKAEIKKLSSAILDGHPVVSKTNEKRLSKNELLEMLHFFSANNDVKVVKCIVKTVKTPSALKKFKISDSHSLEIDPIIMDAIEKYKDSFVNITVLGEELLEVVIT